MTSQLATRRPSHVAKSRRQTVPIPQEPGQKRRKPRRQSGAAVQQENKETVVQRSRLQRTDSDKVIRRNSMERKMSQRNSLKLPQEFLDGLKGLDDSLNRMSMSESCRGLGFNDSKERLDHEENKHGSMFSQAQLEEMSKQALELSDSDTEDEVELGLDVPIVLEDIEEKEE